VSQGILWGQISSVLETALGFVLSVLVIRRLGPAEYGVYGILLSIVALMPLFTRFGFKEIMGKYIPLFSSVEEPGQAKYLLRRLVLGRIVVIAIALGVLLLVSAPLSVALQFPRFLSYFWILALLFTAQELGEFLTSLFTAQLQMRYITVYNLLVRCISLAVTLLLFARYGVSVLYVLYATITGEVVGLVWYATRSKAALLDGQEERTPLVPVIRFGVGISLVNITQLGLGLDKDALLLKVLGRGVAEIGYYNAGLGLLTRAHGFLFSRWGGMTLPVLSEAHNQQGNEGLRRVWTFWIKLMSILGVPVFGYLGAFAAPIVHLVLTDAYTPSVLLMQIWSVITIITTAMGHGLSTELLYVIGKERIALAFRVIGALVGIGLGVVLISWQGVLGAIIANGTVSIFIVLAEVYFATRHVGKLRYPLLFLGKILAATLVGCIPVALLDTTQLWAFLVASGSYFALFMVALHLLKPLAAEDRVILSQIDPRLAILAKWF
jgi:O-antigen/teichoic acid export membrane protein